MTDPSLDSLPNRASSPAVAFTLQPIGLVHAISNRKTRLPRYFTTKGRAALEVFHPYLPGLMGLYGGCELWVLTCHPPTGRFPTELGPNAERLQGAFASNTVERPNPIEFLRARVVALDLERGLLEVEGLDVEDGSPLLDIRPATTPHQRLHHTQD